MFLEHIMLQSSCGCNIRYVLLPVANVLYFHISILEVRAQCPVRPFPVVCIIIIIIIIIVVIIIIMLSLVTVLSY
jgi:hypothetical protein